MIAILFRHVVEGSAYGDAYELFTGQNTREDTYRELHLFSICTSSVHVTYGLCQRHAGAHVVDAFLDGEIRQEPCDGSCKAGARLEDFKEFYRHGTFAYVDREEDAWLRFSAEVRETFRCETETHGRMFSMCRHEDGDGDTQTWCFGKYHVRACCTEYGMGHVFALEHCNQRGCVPLKVRLPAGVVRWLKAHRK